MGCSCCIVLHCATMSHNQKPLMMVARAPRLWRPTHKSHKQEQHTSLRSSPCLRMRGSSFWGSHGLRAV